MTDIRQGLDAAPMGAFRWAAIGVCMLLNMIDGFDVLVMAFTASAVSAEWTLTGSQLGVLLSAGLFGMAAGSLFVAPWADKVGRRPVTLGCLLLSGTTMVLAAGARTYVELAAMRALTGIGIGGILACSNVIASEYASARWRSLAVSLQSTGYALGATLGGMIAVWLLSAHGWRSVFLFGGIATLAAIPAVLWRLPESLDFLLTRQPARALDRINALARRSRLPAIAALPPLRPQAGTHAGVRTLLTPRLQRPTLLVWLSFFLVLFGFHFVMNWTPKLLVSAGMTQQQGVSSGVLLSVGGIVGTVVLGALSARFAVHRVLAVFMIVTAGLLSIFVMQAADAAMAFMIAFSIGIFLNACVAGLYVIAPLVYDTSVRATGVGWGIGIGRIGSIMSPLVAGVLIDKGLQPAQLYVGFGMAFVLAAVVVLLHRIRSPRETLPQAADAATANH
ncbi:4-hydroxybenzoate transporter PcaK [Delftia tsuruhatensis]|uniref:MFS transporter n=1 Tax=Delftia tsuruhatensis TaxID=180282 RepID=UPI001E6AA7DE|nr:MFS transporter [Delftia tsuruhatensis]CAB5663219.1 4-hydroxybenzoate transporter PcaK [Delftia tsuruhatensis]CAC9677294.1 4-hydroxybenzoate transporter PcaK [Delftia tsuruhatensis]